MPPNGTTPDPNTKQCPEGYEKVFGPLCVEKSMLAAAAAYFPKIPDLNQFTDTPCEAALAALQEASAALQKIMQLPRKLANMAKKLMNRPFQDAQKLADDALSVIDMVDEAINAATAGGAAELQRFKNALSRVLDCPVIADSALGALAAGIISAIDEGRDIMGMLGQLKSMLNNAVAEQLNELKKTPMEAINNAEKTFQDTLKRLGIEEAVRELEKLENCVRGVCDMVEIAGRLPETAQHAWESIGGAWSAAPGRLTATTKRMGGTFMQEWNEASAAVGRVAAAVKTTR